MVVIERRPDIAVRIRHEVTGIVLEQHRWVFTEPGAKREGHYAPGGVLVELGKATGNETTEKRHFFLCYL